MTESVIARSRRFDSDTEISLTIFIDVAAKSKIEVAWSACDLVDQIETVSAGTKAELPLLKLAGFGEKRSRTGSLRTNGNLAAITGVEVEYDGGVIGFDAAVRILREAGLGAIVYTTSSHSPDKPRWRILLCCSAALPPSDRAKLVARVNGILGGIVSRESFVLSQAYYYGHRRTNAEHHRVELIEGDFIDLRSDLDAGAIDVAPKAPPVDAAPIEAFFKAQVDWDLVGAATSIEQLEVGAPALCEWLQEELARKSKLHCRWTGGTEGLTDTSRSGRDKSIVQILRAMGCTITDAIACVVAWGNDNPTLGRGSDPYDEHGQAVDWERYWVRCWMRPDDQVPLSVDDLPGLPSKSPPPTRSNPFPEICRKPPGVLGILVEFLSRAAIREVPPEILVSFAIVAVAFCARNRFAAGSDKLSTPIQVYAIVVAKTGVGKTELIKLLSRLLHGAETLRSIVEAFSSGPALLRRLYKLRDGAPWGPTMLLAIDEIGLKLQARQTRSGTSHMKDVMDEVIALYGRADATYGGKAYADERNSIDPIDRPNVNVIGFTTEGPLMSALSKADAESGFANRFVLANASDVDAPQKGFDAIDQSIPEPLAKYLKGIGSASLSFPSPKPETTHGPLPQRDQLQKALGAKDPLRMPFDPGALTFLEEVRRRVNEKEAGADNLTGSIWTRTRQLVITVGGILAIGEIDIEAPTVPSITRLHLEWAWDFVCWSNQNWLDAFHGKISNNDEQVAMNEIKDLLAKGSDYAPGGRLASRANFGNAKNNAAICAQGWMPASLMGRELRSITKDQRTKALAALIENEEVEKLDWKDDGQTKSTAYRLARQS